MKTLLLLASSLGILSAAGCDHRDGETATLAPTPSGGALADSSKYLLDQEPGGAAGVIDTRAAVNDGDDVVVVGRIGGSENPWIDGRAAFSIVDGSLKACSDIPGDGCQKPWDYCCETDKLPAATALVKIVDESGQNVMADARDLLNVKELSTVVVKGTAQRDEAGNLTVLATGVYEKK